MDSISELYDLFGETAFCNICLEDCLEGQRVRNLSTCKHVFHMKCIDTWFIQNKSCPVCRSEYSIETIKSETYENINVLERYYLTWILIHGILKKFKTSNEYNSKKETIKQFFLHFKYQNYKPFPIDLDTRYSLDISKKYIASKIQRLQHIEKNKIHKQPNIYRWIVKLETIPNIQHLWVM